MKARITFSLLGIQLGSIDLDLDFLGAAEQAVDKEVGKAVQATRRLVKGASRLWVRGMVS